MVVSVLTWRLLAIRLSLNGKINSNVFDVVIAPSYGRAIKENVVLGYSALLGFNTSHSSDSSQEGMSNGYQIGATVFIEKFYHLGKDFHLSARSDPGVHYPYSHYRQLSHGILANESETQGYGVGVSFSPSIALLERR